MKYNVVDEDEDGGIVGEGGGEEAAGGRTSASAAARSIERLLTCKIRHLESEITRLKLELSTKDSDLGQVSDQLLKVRAPRRLASSVCILCVDVPCTHAAVCRRCGCPTQSDDRCRDQVALATRLEDDLAMAQRTVTEQSAEQSSLAKVCLTMVFLCRCPCWVRALC